MKKTIRVLLKTLVGIAVAVVVVVIAAVVAVNIPSVRQRIMQQSVTMLSEKLNTRVALEKASFSIFGGYLNLYGVEIDDLQQRKMLQMKELTINLELQPLLQQCVVIEEITVDGLQARLTKKTDSVPANYQFIIDAFKKDKKTTPDKKNERKKKKMTLNVSYVKLTDIHVAYDKYDCLLKRATVEETDSNKHDVTIENLQAQWVAKLKKGPMDCTASIDELKVSREGKHYDTTVSGLHYKTDNHKPRKNTGKPKRGFFDIGHLDVTADLQLNIDQTGKDSLKFQLTEGRAQDPVTGIDIHKLQTGGVYTKGKVLFSNIVVQQVSTVIKVASAEMLLPNKKEGRRLSYRTGNITGKTHLKDISRPFAPVLKKFELPLNLSLTMSGTDSTMSFRNIHVFTNDKRLTIAATGNISHLKQKELLNVHFNVTSMHARKGIAEKVINQFTVKKMMMGQLQKLGDISYTGDFSVLWKKEAFRGRVHTQAGDISFNFALDEKNKYVNGEASTTNLALGHVMNLKKLGNIDASAKFSIDISKPRTAIMRRKLGGKLPIGTVHATVNDCPYMGIHVKHVTADIKSNGAVATGDVKKTGKVGDLSFSFSFTDTNEMHKMKITHPGLKIHWPWEKSEAAKEEKRKAKEEKQLKKEEEKKKKAEEKLKKKEEKLKKKEEKKKAEEAGKEGKKKKKFLFF